MGTLADATGDRVLLRASEMAGIYGLTTMGLMLAAEQSAAVGMRGEALTFERRVYLYARVAARYGALALEAHARIR